MYRKQVEQMSANGTVGAYVTVSNAEIYEDGTFSGGEIRINYCDSMNILPLTVINDEIVEVAFVGVNYEKLKKVYVMVMFLKGQDERYIAETHYFKDTGEEIKERAQIVQLDVVKPFAIMRNAKVNNLQMQGYGLPKIWSAIAPLKTIDLTMTMWNRDLLKSDKIVLVNEALMQKDENGKIKMNPQMKKIFVQLGRDKLPEEKALWQEYNPTVRTAEVVQSLETALSILSMMFGFGTKKYTFESGRIVTATEYIGENQDAMKEVNSQRKESTAYIQDIIQAIAYFYELTQGRKLNINSLDIAIDYDDTYIEDKQSTAQALRNDALTFDIPRLKIMYFMKQYGFTEEEATELLNEEIQDDGEEDEEE
nr:MAG TPA: portal protein [Caudoviricetes sp.]